jgi:hypothetical protein
MCIVATDELPVNLIKIVTFQHHGTDNARPCCRLHNDADDAEKDVEIALDGWTVTSTTNGKLSASHAPVHFPVCDIPDLVIGHLSVGEVESAVCA